MYFKSHKKGFLLLTKFYILSVNIVVIVAQHLICYSGLCWFPLLYGVMFLLIYNISEYRINLFFLSQVQLLTVSVLFIHSWVIFLLLLKPTSISLSYLFHLLL